jgi:DNA-binding response OmpR family regulator
MAKILVVEDERDIASMIAEHLEFEHYKVETAFDGDEAQGMLRVREYDMLILDWELPLISGIEVCQKYRASGGRVPVLMLTGNTAVLDKVKGLDSGADDYLTKPFSLDELSARVRALLRRGETKQSLGGLRFQDIILEPNTHEVTKGGKELKLIPKEFAILELLMRYPGKVFTADAILDRVWDQSEYPAPYVVRTHVMNLRRKVGEGVIETVHGVGYKIPSETR